MGFGNAEHVDFRGINGAQQMSGKQLTGGFLLAQQHPLETIKRAVLAMEFKPPMI